MTTVVVIDAAELERVIGSLNTAVDWIESGTPADLCAAAEIVNLVLDDLEPLRTEKGDAREDVALKSLPHRPGRTDDEDCSARSG